MFLVRSALHMPGFIRHTRRRAGTTMNMTEGRPLALLSVFRFRF